MKSKSKRVAIYIRKSEEVEQTLNQLLRLVLNDPRLKLISVLIDSDEYVWQRPFLISLYESKKIEGVVVEEYSELCYSNKTYLETAMLIDKGFNVLVVDGNGQLMPINAS